jgi:3-isopropylmalate/(R)-2-methylmalate dehydratase small subunit
MYLRGSAINNGFLAIECKDVVEKIKYSDELEIDVEGGVIKNLTQDEEYNFVPLPKFAMDLLEKGGLINYIKEK